MQITQGEVILRDTRASDIEDEIRWMNTDTDWFYADTPWETLEPVDPEELRREMEGIMAGGKKADAIILEKVYGDRKEDR